MSGSRLIYFDNQPIVDEVTLAVIPVSRVTGAVVRAGVAAKVKGLPDRPVTNASGMLVFLNLPVSVDPYEIELDAAKAGFFSPPAIAYTPPAANDPDREAKRRLEVLLAPLPDHPFPSDSTVIRGVVVRGSSPVAGADIACKPPGGGADFIGRSAARGAFACGLRLPPPADFDTRKPVKVQVTLSEGADQRQLIVDVTGGRSHSFEEPVDLAGINEPGLFIR